MNPILYTSTNLKTQPVSFKEALLKGLAPDRGLFMPQRIPVLSPQEIKSFASQDYFEMAFTIAKKFLTGQIPDGELKRLVKEAYDFEVPLERVTERKYVMRLDQGPTASFKDFAARLMARLMQYFLKQDEGHLQILTATSGDTGSAIANAFYGLEHIQVVVLFPEKEVTARQRKQMTTLGNNIQIIALDAKFDDCQAMVKRAFTDPDLQHLQLSSANSINIGRLLPQSMYYVYASMKLARSEHDQVIFSVPSGNFGDLMGGLIAKRMGIPIKKFVIATNANDEFPVFLRTGQYDKIEPSINCMSSAMNVGHPSNLARVVALYGGVMDENGYISQMPAMEQMREDLYAVSISEEETTQTIRDAYRDHQLLLEPHGAVAWAALKRFLHEHPDADSKDTFCVSLETAHPAKFPEQIRKILSLDPKLPLSLEGIEDKDESFLHMKNDYEDFKGYLLGRYF